MIIGHHLVHGYFKRALSVGALEHTYCLAGLAQLGKRTLARLVAAEFLGTTVGQLRQHADYLYVAREVDEKTGERKRDISIDQARALRSALGGSSWSGRRVVVIDEAEYLNESSANALLKLLEEPPADTIIFLLVENEALLLPTICSRVQLFSLNPVALPEVTAGLEKIHGISTPLATECAAFSGGRPGKAITLAQDPGLLAAQHAALAAWQRLSQESFADRFAKIEELLDIKTPEDGVSVPLSDWQLWWRAELLKNLQLTALAGGPSNGAAVSNRSAAELVAIIDATQETASLLRQNIHPRLALENLVINF